MGLKGRESIYKGKVVDLSVDTVELPDGTSCRLEMIRHPGAAAVLPVDDRGRAVLVRQYRYATGGFLLEVPAGKLDGGEPPERCAGREVREETGYLVGELIPLGWIWTTPGFTDERIWLYLARGLTPGPQELQEDELLEVEHLSLADAVAAAESGEIQDGKSVCTLLRAAAYLRS